MSRPEGSRLRRFIWILVLLTAVGATGVIAMSATASKHTPSTTGTVTSVPSADTIAVRIPAKGKKKAKTVRVTATDVAVNQLTDDGVYFWLEPTQAPVGSTST